MTSSHCILGKNNVFRGGVILGNASVDDFKTVISRISSGGKSVVQVNGETYTFDGAKNVSVINGKIFVDGKEVEHKASGPTINVTVTIHGDVGSVETNSSDVTVNGNVTGPIQTTSGQVGVTGNSGSINTTSGDVDVKKGVEGPIVTTSGDVKIGGNAGALSKPSVVMCRCREMLKVKLRP